MTTADLRGVPETMLQTLYARAAYSQKPSALFRDETSISIVSRLDYDFSHAEKDAMMSDGVIARTLLLDRLVWDFVRDNPDATVLNLACGLDTRFYRVDNGRIRWYNLDLPETIAVRRRFFCEEERVSMIARSAMDPAWPGEVAPPQGPVLAVIEGLTMYLTEADVRRLLTILESSFSHLRVLVEIMSPFAVAHIKEKSIEASRAKFTWGAASGRALEALAPGLAWAGDVSLVEGMKELYPAYRLVGWLPPVKSISNKLAILQK